MSPFTEQYKTRTPHCNQTACSDNAAHESTVTYISPIKHIINETFGDTAELAACAAGLRSKVLMHKAKLFARDAALEMRTKEAAELVEAALERKVLAESDYRNALAARGDFDHSVLPFVANLEGYEHEEILAVGQGPIPVRLFHEGSSRTPRYAARLGSG
jgi:hypothetical protein